MLTSNCIECDAAVSVGDDVVIGEVVPCPECHIDLEVVSTDPLQLELAPEIEEDWGE